MKLVIGLGNPGEKFKNTRHNIGFQIIDELIKEGDFPGFRILKKYHSLISEGFLNKEKIIAAKPQTFMNNSGRAIKALYNFHKIKIDSLIIIHDDIDLPLGKLKLQKNRGAAGHKGVESIIKELGTKNFWRIRTGIQPKNGKPADIERFVLQKFKREEQKIITEVVKQASQSVRSLIK